MKQKIFVLCVGFEPTQPKLVDLKSTPLDLSGNIAFPIPGIEPGPIRWKRIILTTRPYRWVPDAGFEPATFSLM